LDEGLECARIVAVSEAINSCFADGQFAVGLGDIHEVGDSFIIRKVLQGINSPFLNNRILVFFDDILEGSRGAKTVLSLGEIFWSA
jgi:hypothetical protein